MKLGSKQEGKTGSEMVDKEAGLVFEVAKVDADQVGEVKLVAEAIVKVAKEHMLAMTKSTWAPGREAILKKLLCEVVLRGLRVPR